MENEITKEINIEHRFHRTMIGTKGEKIREIRDQYNQVGKRLPGLIAGMIDGMNDKNLPNS